MEIRELKSKNEMLANYDLLTEVYPELTMDEYSNELDEMIPHNYGQVVIYDGENCLGLTGFWIGTKLWCGRYLELDNVVVSKKHRSKGAGKKLFEYMQEKAKNQNCNMLALDSYSDNFKAHKFFYGQGFVPRGFHFINILNKLGIR
ncbi:MAG: GNAT family N-acetyltransferase [Crocinitomicaceae bacterium]|nr:GNAT family N-acetyltransferase [Crocinitomicaceae bacterium]